MIGHSRFENALNLSYAPRRLSVTLYMCNSLHRLSLSTEAPNRGGAMLRMRMRITMVMMMVWRRSRPDRSSSRPSGRPRYGSVRTVRMRTVSGRFRRLPPLFLFYTLLYTSHYAILSRRFCSSRQTLTCFSFLVQSSGLVEQTSDTLLHFFREL